MSAEITAPQTRTKQTQNYFLKTILGSRHPETVTTSTQKEIEMVKTGKKKAKRSFKDTYKSSGLKAADLSPKGEDFEIESVEEGEIEGDPKLFVHFRNDDRSWTLNLTNCIALEDATGSDDPDDWADLKVKLFNDRTVTSPSGVRGGIRIRSVLNAPGSEEEEVDLDDLDSEEEFDE